MDQHHRSPRRLSRTDQRLLTQGAMIGAAVAILVLLVAQLALGVGA